jgi:hypothetical protein
MRCFNVWNHLLQRLGGTDKSSSQFSSGEVLAMFEVGRWYEFHMVSDDGEGTLEFTDEVVAVELPLIKLRSANGGESVINTHSRNFVRAIAIQTRKA